MPSAQITDIPIPREVVNGKITTLTGRQIPIPPRVRLETGRNATMDVHALNRWLAKQAVEEAKARNDDFNLIGFQQEADMMARNSKKDMPPASMDAMNLYLFGEAHPEFVLEPIPVEKEAAYVCIH